MFTILDDFARISHHVLRCFPRQLCKCPYNIDISDLRQNEITFPSWVSLNFVFRDTLSQKSKLTHNPLFS
jgi:hypothetical protein